jgi:hypothetical protein
VASRHLKGRRRAAVAAMRLLVVKNLTPGARRAHARR